MGSKRYRARHMRRTPGSGRKALRSIGTMLVIASCIITCVITMPVFVRGADIASRIRIRQDVASASPDIVIPKTGSSEPSPLPPVTWDLILSPSQIAMKEAIREDLPTMGEISDSTPLSWPHLPGFSCDADEIKTLMGMLYSDSPEMSVYTNGQHSVSESHVVLGTYRISAKGMGSERDKERELHAVTNAINEIVAEIDAEMAPASRTQPATFLFTERDLAVKTGHDDDYLYATWAEAKLVERCRYSDGIDDTAHDNDIYGALIEGESKCYGMSCALKAILDRLGVPSFVATGYLHGDENARHAVTILWVEGGWHVMDATVPSRKTLPDHVGWHLVSCPVRIGDMGQIISIPCFVHDFEGPLGEIVVPFEDYAEQHELSLDEDCQDLMSAYEKEIGIRG